MVDYNTSHNANLPTHQPAKVPVVDIAPLIQSQAPIGSITEHGNLSPTGHDQITECSHFIIRF